MYVDVGNEDCILRMIGFLQPLIVSGPPLKH